MEGWDRCDGDGLREIETLEAVRLVSSEELAAISGGTVSSNR